jgi:hypothetical protein
MDGTRLANVEFRWNEIRRLVPFQPINCVSEDSVTHRVNCNVCTDFANAGVRSFQGDVDAHIAKSYLYSPNVTSERHRIELHPQRLFVFCTARHNRTAISLSVNGRAKLGEETEALCAIKNHTKYHGALRVRSRTLLWNGGVKWWVSRRPENGEESTRRLSHRRLVLVKTLPHP